ncbi:MAG: Na+/H+ antiporter subunit E [Vicinamibacterales bacterium]
MTPQVFGAAWLVFVWLALTADASRTGLAAAVALAAGLVTYFRLTGSARTRGRFHPLRAASFAAFFLVRFLHANLQVALAVLLPDRVRDRRAIVAVRIAAPNETTTTLLAMAVTLTPGTFILEVQRQPAVVFVHVLQFNSLWETRLDVLDLERRIVEAFGPPGAVREVLALMEEVRTERAANASGTARKKGGTER